MARSALVPSRAARACRAEALVTPSGATSSQAVHPIAYSTEWSPQPATSAENSRTPIPGARSTTRITGREAISSGLTTLCIPASSPSGKGRETSNPPSRTSTARMPSGTARDRVAMTSVGSKTTESATS